MVRVKRAGVADGSGNAKVGEGEALGEAAVMATLGDGVGVGWVSE